jgi:uncharacterized protein
MKAETVSTLSPSCTAFLGTQRIAGGTYEAVRQQLAAMRLPQGGGLLVFDDASAELVDHPWPEGYSPPAPIGVAPGPEVDSAASASAPPSVGRPRLGVVAREVTLLPRHWEWLAQQRGGASAALRRLVEEARKTYAEQDTQRHAKERTYRFMGAIGGALPGFEEASRALFARDKGGFSESIGHWPNDVKAYLAWLARDAFGSN